MKPTGIGEHLRNHHSVLRVIFCLAIVTVLEARGITFFVTNPSDTTNITSLRGAIIAANRNGGQTTIILPRPNYELTLTGPSGDGAMTGDLGITRGHVTIIGLSPTVEIDASPLGDRVFHVWPRASLTLKNVSLRGGFVPNGQWGGAIFNEGRLDLMRCVLTGNRSGRPLDPYFPIPTVGKGGAVFSSGILFMEGCKVTGNVGADGGGIWNGGAAILKFCLLSSNSASDSNVTDDWGSGAPGGDGGAIHNTGTLILDSCIVSSNSSGRGADGSLFLPLTSPLGPFGPGGSGGNGGGIWNSNRLLLRFCTISGNTSGAGGSGELDGSGTGGNGAGIYNAGTAELHSCTISGNSAGEGGTGIVGFYMAGGAGNAGGSGAGVFTSGKLALTSCTIALNACGEGGSGGNALYVMAPGSPELASSGGDGGNGGGLCLAGASAATVIRNTIIASNVAGRGGLGGSAFANIGDLLFHGTNGIDGSGPDVFGNLNSGGFNLISLVEMSATISNHTSTDILGSPAFPVDPFLGALQDNGGSTLTHALLPGSPAIDRGYSFGIHRDQRGQPRPVNFRDIPNANGGDGSDIGAEEIAVPRQGTPLR